MEKKPVKPIQHGIIDYGFSSIQLFIPTMMNLNSESRNVYSVLGVGFLAVNALTDTPVGLRKKLSFRKHQRADELFLATLALLPAYKPVRKDRKTLSFHLALLGLAVTHYLLTDYNPQKRFCGRTFRFFGISFFL